VITIGTPIKSLAGCSMFSTKSMMFFAYYSFGIFEAFLLVAISSSIEKLAVICAIIVFF
jgi:hypothetical protein